MATIKTHEDYVMRVSKFIKVGSRVKRELYRAYSLTRYQKEFRTTLDIPFYSDVVGTVIDINNFSSGVIGRWDVQWDDGCRYWYSLGHIIPEWAMQKWEFDEWLLSKNTENTVVVSDISSQ